MRKCTAPRTAVKLTLQPRSSSGLRGQWSTAGGGIPFTCSHEPIHRRPRHLACSQAIIVLHPWLLARSWAGLAGSSLCSSVHGLGPARRHTHGRIALMRQSLVHSPQKAPNCRGGGTVAFMLRGSTVFPAFGSAGMQTSSASTVSNSSSYFHKRHGYGVFDRSGTEGA
jgi:hypothetical protein